MKTLAAIFQYTVTALSAVVVAEHTLAADSGKAKQQLAVDLIANESQVAGFAVPSLQPFLPSFVNLAVAGFNLAGLFQHKAQAKTVTASAK